MKSKTQTGIIAEVILECIDAGMTDKQKIYDKVQESLGIPRPTIRRVAKQLKADLLKKIEVLSITDDKPIVI